MIDEIRENPDKVLKDDEKMKEVISDPDLVISLLKAKNKSNLIVSVDGEDVELVKPQELPKPLFKRHIL